MPPPPVSRNTPKPPPTPKPAPLPPKAPPAAANTQPPKPKPSVHTADTFGPKKSPGSEQRLTNPSRNVKEAEEPKGLKNHETYPKLLDTPLTVTQQVQDGKDRIATFRENRQAGNGRLKSTWEGTKDNFKKSIADGKNPKDLDTRLGKAGKLNTLAKLGVGTHGLLDGKGSKAWNALNGGLTRGTPEQRNKALADLADGGKTATETLKAGLETGRDVQKYTSAYRAASKSLEADAPGLNNKGRRAIARDIAKTTFNKVDAADGANDARFGELRNGNRTTAKNLAAKAHDATNNQAKRLLSTGTQEGFEAADNALKAGVKAGAKSAGGALARSAGRFVPGANVAIAAFDTAKAVSVWKDPKSNAGQKATATLTAAGSVLAATNIPVVSQAGAAISTVSDFVGSFF